MRIVSITDLKEELFDLVRRVHKTHDEVFIEEDGEVKAVLVDADKFGSMGATLDLLTRPEMVRQVEDAATLDADQLRAASFSIEEVWDAIRVGPPPVSPPVSLPEQSLGWTDEPVNPPGYLTGLTLYDTPGIGEVDDEISAAGVDLMHQLARHHSAETTGEIQQSLQSPGFLESLSRWLSRQSAIMALLLNRPEEHLWVPHYQDLLAARLDRISQQRQMLAFEQQVERRRRLLMETTRRRQAVPGRPRPLRGSIQPTQQPGRGAVIQRRSSENASATRASENQYDG